MNKRFRIFLSIIVLIGALLSACAPVTPVAPSEANNDQETCVYPVPDNNNRWREGACVYVDTNVYTLKVQVVGDMASNQTQNGSISGVSINGTGGVSGRIWTEGKGILPVRVVSIDPAFEGVTPEDTIVLKTTDLKAVGLPVGAYATFLCNRDPEVLSPVYDLQTMTTDRVTYELDDCRMASPEFKMSPE